jgi:hypothetical protein
VQAVVSCTVRHRRSLAVMQRVDMQYAGEIRSRAVYGVRAAAPRLSPPRLKLTSRQHRAVIGSAARLGHRR